MRCPPNSCSEPTFEALSIGTGQGQISIIPLDESSEANGRLLAAAYNAFDSAAKNIGCNAIELAEAMQDGVLLAEALDNADLILYHTPHLDRAAFDKATAVVAKVKGGVS